LKLIEYDLDSRIHGVSVSALASGDNVGVFSIRMTVESKTDKC
jgi:hypothetical protein